MWLRFLPGGEEANKFCVIFLIMKDPEIIGIIVSSNLEGISAAFQDGH